MKPESLTSGAWFIRPATRLDMRKRKGRCKACGVRGPLFARFGHYGPKYDDPLERRYCEGCLEAEAEDLDERMCR